jgi:hypothetical protein
MAHLTLKNGLRASCSAQGSAAATLRAEGTDLPGGLCEVILQAAPGEAQRLAVSFAVPVGVALVPAARILVVGEDRVAGRGVVSLGDLLGTGQRAVLDASAIVTKAAGEALLAGLGGFAPDFPRITLSEASIEIAFEPGRRLAEPLEIPLVIGTSQDALPLLETYGDVLARHARPVGPVPTGWNSWDYYQASVTMKELRAELAAIRESGLAGRLRHFCIDMGWEESWGDWTPNRGFPDLAQAATEIRAAGMEPGIWLAPLQARTTLPLARHRRGMFCRDAAGDPVVRSGHLLLDPTHPWTQEWLSGLCRGLRAAGFTLFKIDYLYRDYLEAMDHLHVPMGKVAAARLFLQIIRDAIGDDAHLLNCGAPVAAAVGLADSSRVSTDIHNFWGHIRNSAVQVSMSYWLNGRVWINDPDFALIRCAETTDDPYLNVPYTRRPFTDPEGFWMAGAEATLAELKTWLALVHLCGGSLCLSDSIARLNGLGLSLLERLLAEPTAPARPLDLFECTPPRVWLAPEWLGLFNFADEPAQIQVPNGLPGRGVDFWTGEDVALGAEVALPPHGSLLVKL